MEIPFQYRLNKNKLHWMSLRHKSKNNAKRTLCHYMTKTANTQKFNITLIMVSVTFGSRLTIYELLFIKFNK